MISLFLVVVVTIVLLLSSTTAAETTTTSTSIASPSKDKKTLVTFAYSEHSEDHKSNLEYFLTFGLPKTIESNFHVLIVINGESMIDFSSYISNELQDKVVWLYNRGNEGFDFSAWGDGHSYLFNDCLSWEWMKKLGDSDGSSSITEKSSNPNYYSYFLFLNASVKGPILPFTPFYNHKRKVFDLPHSSDLLSMDKYPQFQLSNNYDYTTIFTKHITDKTKLVGTTFNCVVGPKRWHLQSMTLATDIIGYNYVFRPLLIELEGKILDKTSAIYSGEVVISQNYLDFGFDLYALSLSSMEGITISRANENVVDSVCKKWQGRTKYGCFDPYYEVSKTTKDLVISDIDPLVHPFEVVFFKTNIRGGHKMDTFVAEYEEWRRGEVRVGGDGGGGNILRGSDEL